MTLGGTGSELPRIHSTFTSHGVTVQNPTRDGQGFPARGSQFTFTQGPLSGSWALHPWEGLAKALCPAGPGCSVPRDIPACQVPVPLPAPSQAHDGGRGISPASSGDSQSLGRKRPGGDTQARL